MGRKQIVQELLKELYSIDGSMKQHEAALIKTINLLLDKQPQAVLDAASREALKNELIKKAEELRLQKSSQQSRTDSGQTNSFEQLFLDSLKKFSYATTIAIFVIFATFPVWYPLAAKKLPGTTVRQELAAVSQSKITKIENDAFGSLSAMDEAAPAQGLAVGRGGGGGGAAQAPAGDAKQVSATMPPYESEHYKYVYRGDELGALDERMEVYKRIKSPAGGAGDNLVSQYGAGLFNSTSFSDLKLLNLSLAEDKDFGYSIYIDNNEGTVSIGQYWLGWQKYFSAAGQSALSLSDIPDDQTLVSLADAFIAEHGINLENYESGQVDTSWRQQLIAGDSGQPAYVPDQISVIYPLKVSGHEIYQFGGQRDGIYVSIDIRNKKVAGLWNLTAQNYESSMYAIEQSNDAILKAAEEGGLYNRNYGDASKVTEVEIGTPQLSYVKNYNYANGQNEELLIPAYLFPVLEAPEGQFYFSKTITVPLVKDVLDNLEKNIGAVTR